MKGQRKRSPKQDRGAGQEQGGSAEKRHCSRSPGACPRARRARQANAAPHCFAAPRVARPRVQDGLWVGRGSAKRGRRMAPQMHKIASPQRPKIETTVAVFAHPWTNFRSHFEDQILVPKTGPRRRRTATTNDHSVYDLLTKEPFGYSSGRSPRSRFRDHQVVLESGPFSGSVSQFWATLLACCLSTPGWRNSGLEVP